MSNNRERENMDVRNHIGSLSWPTCGPRQHWGVCAFLAAACLVIAGCSDGTGADAQKAAAGSIKVIAVTKVAEASKELLNCVRNGDFKTWYAGAPSPEHFVAPNSTFSSIQRVQRGANAFVARQTWKVEEIEAGLPDMFRVYVGGVKKESSYRLRVVAASELGSSASVGVWECAGEGADEKCEPLDPELMVILPGHIAAKSYERTFKTKNGGQLAIAFHQNSVGRKPGTVEWYSVSLNPVESENN